MEREPSDAESLAESDGGAQALFALLRPLGVLVPVVAGEFTEVNFRDHARAKYGEIEQVESTNEDPKERKHMDPFNRVLQDLQLRLNREGLIADPKSYLRYRKIDKGEEYYDAEDPFLDDENLMERCGLNKRDLADSESSYSRSGPTEAASEDAVQCFPHLFTFDNDPQNDFLSDSEESELEFIDPPGWRRSQTLPQLPEPVSRCLEKLENILETQLQQEEVDTRDVVKLLSDMVSELWISMHQNSGHMDFDTSLPRLMVKPISRMTSAVRSRDIKTWWIREMICHNFMHHMAVEDECVRQVKTSPLFDGQVKHIQLAVTDWTEQRRQKKDSPPTKSEEAPKPDETPRLEVGSDEPPRQIRLVDNSKPEDTFPPSIGLIPVPIVPVSDAVPNMPSTQITPSVHGYRAIPSAPTPGTEAAPLDENPKSAFILLDSAGYVLTPPGLEPATPPHISPVVPSPQLPYIPPSCSPQASPIPDTLPTPAIPSAQPPASQNNSWSEGVDIEGLVERSPLKSIFKPLDDMADAFNRLKTFVRDVQSAGYEEMVSGVKSEMHTSSTARLATMLSSLIDFQTGKKFQVPAKYVEEQLKNYTVYRKTQA